MSYDTEEDNPNNMRNAALLYTTIKALFVLLVFTFIMSGIWNGVLCTLFLSIPHIKFTQMGALLIMSYLLTRWVAGAWMAAYKTTVVDLIVDIMKTRLGDMIIKHVDNDKQ